MPEFPRYNSSGQLTTQRPQPLAPQDTEGAVQEQMGNTFEKAQGAVVKWDDAMQTMRNTQADYNLQSGIMAQKEKVLNDPDQNNEETHIKELQDLYSKSGAEQTQDKLRFKLMAQEAEIWTRGEFKKKKVYTARANTDDIIAMHVANPVVGGRGDTMQYLKSYMQTQVDANLFNDDEAMTILNNAEKSATETVLNREMVAAATSTDPTKVKEFTESLKSKTLFGKSLSSKTVAEFTDKAYRMSEKIKSQNQRDLFVTSAENMKKLVDNTLTDQEVDKQVMEEKMSPEIGAIWKASQANPDDWQTAVDDKVIKPASGSAQILMGIAQAVTDGKTDVSKTQILEIALKQYNAKKISKTDVAWILRSITEKDKNPDSPIWDSLKTAFAMGGAGAMRQFMSVWDFVKDPKKVMAGIKKDQAKQRFKNINLTDNEPDSVVDAFNLVHGYSIPPSSSTDDEGAEVDPYSGKEPD